MKKIIKENKGLSAAYLAIIILVPLGIPLVAAIELIRRNRKKSNKK